MTDLAADARHLGELKTACWDAVRAFNTGEGKPSAVFEARDALDVACEAFRKRHFPKAREVFAVADSTIGQPLSVYRRTPTGRAVLVYDAQKRPAQPSEEG